MAYRILLVDDSPLIIDINSKALEMAGYKVLKAADGKSCMQILKSDTVDMIILDILLPDVNGLDICRKIKAKLDIPIIFLSSLGENEHIIEGLRAGGDDYLKKPYDVNVLIARIEARLRSVARDGNKRNISHMGLRLDTLAMIGYCGEQDLLLTQKEFQLLLMLMRNPGGFTTPETLYENIWGFAPEGDYKSIYTTVSRLNKKLEKAGSKVKVSFQRGSGYSIEDI